LLREAVVLGDHLAHAALGDGARTLDRALVLLVLAPPEATRTIELDEAAHLLADRVVLAELRVRVHDGRLEVGHRDVVGIDVDEEAVALDLELVLALVAIDTRE